MKKKLALFFMLALVFSLAACGNPQTDGGEEVLPNKSPEELIAEGNYQDAYKVLLSKGDEASKAELEKFIFLPQQTVETDTYYNRSSTHAYTWDAEGRPQKVSSSSGQNTAEVLYTYEDGKYSFSRNGVLSQEVMLNDAGQVIRSDYHRSDGEINVTLYEYDDQGRLTKTTETIPGNDTPTIKVYTYGSNGKLASKAYFYGEEASDSMTYTYDADGKLILLHENIPSDGNQYDTVYTYNDKGQLVSESEDKTNRNGQKTHRRDKTYTYDEKGRVISSTNVYADDNYTYQYQWTYDDLGNLTKQVYARGASPDSMRESIVEHTGYKAFYLPDPHVVLDEVLKSFQPELD